MISSAEMSDTFMSKLASLVRAIVLELAIGVIKWFRSKGSKVCY